MKKLTFGTLVCVFMATVSLAQINNATLTGTVADATGAVLPGVAITATNTATGVVTTAVSNEAGAYNIQSLIPGTYTLSGELPGFQKQTYENVLLGNAVTVRLNFSLQVSSQAQNVEVTIAADTLIATSSSSIGTVLGEKRVSNLPVVGNNVLDMLNVLGGLDNLVFTSANPSAANAFGREGTTLAGVSAQNTPVLRDGVMVQDTRYPTGINSATIINPDLVGEIRLIVAPVDVEFGRGNGAVQITTRSGTNEFHGAGVWSIQNSALNANTWTNNRSGLPINYFNNHQLTGSRKN
jgi:Carboxypeptidase regulatory-like domain